MVISDIFNAFNLKKNSTVGIIYFHSFHKVCKIIEQEEKYQSISCFNKLLSSISCFWPCISWYFVVFPDNSCDLQVFPDGIS
jgi:hypothetical protein